MKIQTVVIGGAHLTKLTLSLLAAWLTLDWRVRRMRRAFEKQLIRVGMSKKDAQRLSAQFAKLKDNVKNAVKGSMFRIR
jgi:hypothetical protein